MKQRKIPVVLFLLITLLYSAAGISAQETSPDLPEIFTASDTMAMKGFEVRSTTATVHKILGYTTLATGLLTGLLSPERAGVEVHQALGYTTAALAATTMGFGYLAHRKDMDMSSGLSSNNIHMVLGIAGGTMMMIAPFLAPGDAHKVLGELGLLTMGISVVGKIVY